MFNWEKGSYIHIGEKQLPFGTSSQIFLKACWCLGDSSRFEFTILNAYISSTPYLLFNLGKLLNCSMPQYSYHKMQTSTTSVVSFKNWMKRNMKGLVPFLAYSKCSISGLWRYYSVSFHCRLRLESSEQRMNALRNRNDLHILAT